MNDAHKEQIRTQIELRGEQKTASYYNTDKKGLKSWLKDLSEPSKKQTSKIDDAIKVRYIFNIHTNQTIDYVAKQVNVESDDVRNWVSGKKKVPKQHRHKLHKLASSGNIRTVTKSSFVKNMDDEQAEYQVVYKVNKGKLKGEMFFGNTFFHGQSPKKSEAVAMENMKAVYKSSGCPISKGSYTKKYVRRYVLLPEARDL